VPNAGGYKNGDFLRISLYLKMIKIQQILIMTDEKKSFIVYRTEPFSVTQNDQFLRSRRYLTLNISVTFSDLAKC